MPVRVFVVLLAIHACVVSAGFYMTGIAAGNAYPSAGDLSDDFGMRAGPSGVPGDIVPVGLNTDPCGTGAAATPRDVTEKLPVPADVNYLFYVVELDEDSVGGNARLTYSVTPDADYRYWFALNWTATSLLGQMSVPSSARYHDFTFQLQLTPYTGPNAGVTYYACMDLTNTPPSTGETYHWFAGSWSQCSNVCGNGTRSREVGCFDAYDAPVNPWYCDQETRPTDFSYCNEFACTPYVFFYDGWTACSAECGEGTRTRTVRCCHFTDADCNVGDYPDINCTESSGQAKPPAVETCYMSPCEQERPATTTGDGTTTASSTTAASSTTTDGGTTGGGTTTSDAATTGTEEETTEGGGTTDDGSTSSGDGETSGSVSVLPAALAGLFVALAAM